LNFFAIKKYRALIIFVVNLPKKQENAQKNYENFSIRHKKIMVILS